jgi:hypothetical protein
MLRLAFLPRFCCSRFKHSDFQGRVPYTNTKCEFFKGQSLESVAGSMEFLNPSNDKLGHLNKHCKGPCIYKIRGGCFFLLFLRSKFLLFLTASKDPNALHFAFENDADVVTSSSVMQLLVDVHPYSLHNSASRRDIPVLIKDFECGFANFYV